MVVRGDDVWAFGGGGGVDRIRPDGAMKVGIESSSIAGMSADDVVLGAALDTARDGFVVVGRTRAAPGQVSTGWVRLVSGDAKRSELVPGPPTGAHLFVGVAEIAPDLHVLAADGARLFRLSGGRLEPIPIDWDDPLTGAKESQPNATCPTADRDLFLGVSGGHGVAWVVGCEEVVLRVSGGARAERVAGDRIKGDFQVLLDFYGVRDKLTLPVVHATCPDSVLIGAAVIQGAGVIQVVPARATTAGPPPDYAGYPVRMIGSGRAVQPTALFANGVQAYLSFTVEGSPLRGFVTSLPATEEDIAIVAPLEQAVTAGAATPSMVVVGTERGQIHVGLQIR